jgi:hypothetical protein
MPFIQSQVATLGTDLVTAMLGGLSVVPGAAFLVTPKVHLYTAGPSPITPGAAVADFTEAAFVGYAQKTLVLPLLGPINLPNGDGIGVHNEVDFLAGAVVAPGEMIQGYWIDDGATAFYYGERFDTPIPIALPGDFISLDVIFPMLNPMAAQ